MCTKTIKLTMRDMGVVGTTRCRKPEYQNGLCAYHYKRSIAKSIPWGERPEYKEVTEEQMLRSCSIKLKTTNAHVLYRYRKATIEKFVSKDNTWIVTDLPVDNKLFCIKYL